MLGEYCQDPSGKKGLKKKKRKKGLSSLPNCLETFQRKNQLSRQRKENHAPRTPAFGSGTHIPENQIPRFTYMLYLDRKSSEKSAPSGSNDSIYSWPLGSEYDKRSLSLSSPDGGEKKKSQTALSSHIHKGILAPPSSSSKAARGMGVAVDFHLTP